MERVRPKKKAQPQLTHVALVPEDQADVPGVTKVERVRPTPKAKPDPAARPRYMMDGYGKPVHAFSITGCDKCVGNVLVVCYREKKHDDQLAVRVYYAGAILLGSMSISPLQVTTHFHHMLDSEDYGMFPTVEKAEAFLRQQLRKEIA